MTGLRNAPQQARSLAKIELILDAAERCFADIGYGATTTNHIAAEADVSVGTVYRWFPDKDAIAGRLVERYLERLNAIVGAAFESRTELTTPELVLGVIHDIADAWHAEVAVSVLSASAAGPNAPAEAAKALRGLLIQQAELLLTMRVPGIPDDERELVARTSVALLEGVLIETSDDASGRDALIEEAAYALAAYLAMKYPLETSVRWTNPMPGLGPSRPSIL